MTQLSQLRLMFAFSLRSSLLCGAMDSCFHLKEATSAEKTQQSESHSDQRQRNFLTPSIAEL